jgi:hypothetical protein
VTFRNRRITALLFAVVPVTAFAANAIGTSIINAHPPRTAATTRIPCASIPISFLVKPTMPGITPLPFPNGYGELIPTEITVHGELIPTQWKPNNYLLIQR